VQRQPFGRKYFSVAPARDQDDGDLGASQHTTDAPTDRTGADHDIPALNL
jgi:hypothetical protein